MVAPAVTTSTNGRTQDVASATVTLPGSSTGYVLFLCWANIGGSVRTLTNPSGWTQVYKGTPVSGEAPWFTTATFISNTASPATGLTFSGTADLAWVCLGLDAIVDDYWYAQNTGNRNGASGSTTYPIPALTSGNAPTEACLLITSQDMQFDDGGSVVPTLPGDWTLATNPSADPNSPYNHIRVGYKNIPAGATSTANWTANYGGGWGWSVDALAVSVDAGGPTDGNVAGVTAPLPLAAPAPAFAAGAAVAGAVGALPVTAPAPALAAGSAVAGPVGALPLVAQVPAVSAGAAVQGAAAGLTLTAPPPAVSAGTNVDVAAVLSTLTLTASAPTLTSTAVVAGAVAALPITAPAPEVSVGGQNGIVAAEPAVVSAISHAPGVSASGGLVSTTGALGIAARTPQVSTSRDVAAAKAAVALTAPAPGVTAVQNVAVDAPAAALSPGVIAPEATATRLVTLRIFRPPRVEADRPDQPTALPEVKNLFGRMAQYAPLTVLRTNGLYRAVLEPEEAAIAAAEEVYLGGREHYLTESEAADLTAAGYGPYIAEAEIFE